MNNQITSCILNLSCSFIFDIQFYPNQVDCLITGTNDAVEVLVAAYPNPTNGIIYLTEEIEYTVFNAQGVIVSQGTGSSFDLSDQAAVFYMLRIEKGVE